MGLSKERKKAEIRYSKNIKIGHNDMNELLILITREFMSLEESRPFDFY